MNVNSTVAEKHEKCGKGPVIIDECWSGYLAVCFYCFETGPIRKTPNDAATAWLSK